VTTDLMLHKASRSESRTHCWYLFEAAGTSAVW